MIAITQRRMRRIPIGFFAAVFLSLAGPHAWAQIDMTSGPSVLSRGGNAPGMRGDQPVALTFYGGAIGTYQQGIYEPNSSGVAVPTDVYGAGVTWGAYGGHDWHRSSLGVDYRGNYNYYTQSGNLSGTNQAIGVAFEHRFNRRWQIALRETAGTTIQPFGGYASPSYVTTDYSSLPLTEIYNTRIYYSQSTGYATYHWSPRTLFTFGSGVSFTSRTAPGLVNGNTAYAFGSWQHQVGRNDALGVSYQYAHYWFPGVYGASSMNAVGGTYQRRLARFSTAYILAGIGRISSYGSESYALSPEIAAILGVPTGVRPFSRIDYIPVIQAYLYYRKQFWSYNAGFSQGTSPGNGVYLTSQQQVASVGASYSGIRKTAFGLNASYTHMNSIWQGAQPFSYFQAGGGGSYLIGHGFNFVCQIDWRVMTAGTTVQRQQGLVASAGIYYASSSVPLSLW